MKLPRRRFLHLAAGAAALPTVARIARAETYPTKPVRIVVGVPAGGPIDISARLIGQWLSERLGQQFIIDNRPGAGGNIGTEAVVRAPADGYTLLLAYASSAINATLFDKLNYDFIRFAHHVRVAGVLKLFKGSFQSFTHRRNRNAPGCMNRRIGMPRDAVWW